MYETFSNCIKLEMTYNLLQQKGNYFPLFVVIHECYCSFTIYEK